MRLELLNLVNERPRAEEIWKGLCAQNEHSYFQAWGWISTWIQSLPAEVALRLAVIFNETGSVEAAFFVGHENVVNQNVFRSRAYVLNQTGKWAFDRLYIEHNRIFRAPGSTISLAEILALLPARWEEFYLSALDKTVFPGNDLDKVATPYELMIAKEMPCPYVDLEQVRERGDYLALLSSSVRSQIKRSYKLYEAQGAIATEVAHDLATALHIYEELIELHQESWNKRGEHGAFATAYFRDFHRTLIQDRFHEGEIQLLRVKSGDKTIGCIYNFVCQGTVHFYQSGLVSEEDNRLKPGYVAHVEAVRLSCAAGHSVYDFLAGVEDYKQRLSTGQRTLVWARVQKPYIKFKIERFVRRAAIAGQARYREWKRGQQRKVATAS